MMNLVLSVVRDSEGIQDDKSTVTDWDTPSKQLA